MRFNYITSALNLILKDFGLVIFIPILVALYYKEYNSIFPFVIAGIIALTISFVMKKYLIIEKTESNLNDIKRSEALMIVSLTWITISIIAAIPYIASGFSVINSLFEAVSGITTTGATILQDYNIPKTLLFWRSFTQWLGGMGIIVLFVAILPQFAVAGRQMFFAEAPGPTEDKFTPRIKNTASALWLIYASLTALCAFLLWLAGMPVFDSICNAFSTLSAGGFSPNARSISGYNSNVINWIIIVFMFIAGTSFVLQSKALTKKKLSLFWKSEEFRFYTIAIAGFSTILTTVLLCQQNYDLFHSITASL